MAPICTDFYVTQKDRKIFDGGFQKKISTFSLIFPLKILGAMLWRNIFADLISAIGRSLKLLQLEEVRAIFFRPYFFRMVVSVRLFLFAESTLRICLTMTLNIYYHGMNNLKFVFFCGAVSNVLK